MSWPLKSDLIASLNHETRINKRNTVYCCSLVVCENDGCNPKESLYCNCALVALNESPVSSLIQSLNFLHLQAWRQDRPVMRKGDFTKRLGNLLKHQGLKFVPTVTRHPRIPVDLLLGTPCLPQQTSVKPLPSTSRPCAVDQRHQVIWQVEHKRYKFELNVTVRSVVFSVTHIYLKFIIF